MRKLSIIIGLVLIVVAMLVAPVWAAEEAGVSCTVTVKLISVEVDTAIVNYGTLAFGETGTFATITATNNGNVAENFDVRGDDASVTGGGTWLLKSAIGVDEYMHSVTGVSVGIGELKLTTSAQDWATNIDAETGTQTFTTKIYMPSAGSAGAGKDVTTSITLIAEAA